MNSPRWRSDAWPLPTKARKSAGVSGGSWTTEGFVDGNTVYPVEFLKDRDNMALLVFGYPALLIHEGPDGRLRQEGEEITGVAEPAGHPDEADVPVPEAGPDGDPDPDGDPHDLAGLEQLRGGLRGHVVVVDHRQAADTLDPGVHDQMGGGLAPLRVGVVDMVVEGDLVPLLGHLQEVVTPQFLTDETGPPRYGHAEIVRQFEPPGVFPREPDQFLHDLEKHPRGIAAERTVGDGHHLIMEGAQGAQTVSRLSHFQGMEKVGHRIGDTVSPIGRHLLDAVRVQVGIEQILKALPGFLLAQNLLDHLEQFMVFSVEEEF